jgi:uncharacterized RDD family membrane protein YckC
MSSVRDQFEYVGFGPRVGATILDAVVFLPILAAQFYFNPVGHSIQRGSLWPWMLWLAACYSTTPYLIVRYGGSPAKLILGMRVVDADGNFLTLSRVLRHDSLFYLSWAIYSILVWKVIAAVTPPLPDYSFSRIGQLMERHGGVWNKLDSGFSFLFVFDCLLVALNKRKRALHDFLAGSYVITKRSYDALNPSPSGAGPVSNGALPAAES